MKQAPGTKLPFSIKSHYNPYRRQSYPSSINQRSASLNHSLLTLVSKVSHNDNCSILVRTMPLWGPSYREHPSYSDRGFASEGYNERPFRSSSHNPSMMLSPRPSLARQSMSYSPLVCGTGSAYGMGRESLYVLP